MSNIDSAYRRITPPLSGPSGLFIFTAGETRRKLMGGDSHIPRLTISKIRNPPCEWPSRLGPDFPWAHRGLVRVYRGRKFRADHDGLGIPGHISDGSMWRSSPSIIWYWVFQNLRRNISPTMDEPPADDEDGINPAQRIRLPNTCVRATKTEISATGPCAQLYLAKTTPWTRTETIDRLYLTKPAPWKKTETSYPVRASRIYKHGRTTHVLRHLRSHRRKDFRARF